ncbi:MAG: hypothetical protein NVV82_11725 [Sporocytophaga sp.]|nr:hypothetical protein [Sporocytophaga sp.]
MIGKIKNIPGPFNLRNLPKCNTSAFSHGLAILMEDETIMAKIKEKIPTETEAGDMPKAVNANDMPTVRITKKINMGTAFDELI